MVDSSTLPTRPARLARGDAEAGSSARAARRWFLIAAPTLAGVCAVIGAAADPAVNEEGAALYAAYAADPDAVQIKSFAYHFAYGLWGAAAIVLAGLVRRRGSWIANGAGVLAFLGITTMPGFIAADFFDSAAGQVFGTDGAVQVGERAGDMWALVLMASTGALGLLLSLPVAALAAWRAGLIPWWAPVAATAGIAGGFMGVGANVPGALLLTAGFLALSVALVRVDRRAWEPAPSGPGAAA